MMDQVPFRILSEQHMEYIQSKARDMVLQLKEEVQWSVHHLANDTEQTEVDHGGGSKIDFPHGTERKDSAVQVAMRPVLPHGVISGKGKQNIGSSLYQKKNSSQANVFSEDLRMVKEKLENLQMDVVKLKEMKTCEKEKLSPLSSSNKREKEFDEQLELLRNDWKKIVPKFEIKQKQGFSGDYVDKRTIPKQMEFQEPYVLKEQRALDRRNDRLKQLHLAYSGTKNINRMTKKGGKSFMRRDQYHRVPKTGNVLESPNGHLRKTSGGSETVAKALEVANTEENACIEELEKKLHEIEEKQENLHKKWHAMSFRIPSGTKKITPLLQSALPYEVLVTDNTKMRPDMGEFSLKQEKKFPAEILSPRKRHANPDTSSNREYENVIPASIERTKIYLESNVVKNIYTGRNDYISSLHKPTSEGVVEFDNWVLSERITDSILDECVEEIVEELDVISLAVISNLYNQEFNSS